MDRVLTLLLVVVSPLFVMLIVVLCLLIEEINQLYGLGFNDRAIQFLFNL